MMLTDLYKLRSSSFGANYIKKLVLFGALLFYGFQGFGQVVTVQAGVDPEEGQIVSGDNFIVSVASIFNFPITVTYEVLITSEAEEGVDFDVLTGEVILPADILGSSVPIQITVIDDNIIEGSETVTIALTSTSAGTIGNQDQATVTIQDNDVAGFIMSPASLTTVENGPPEQFTVVLTAEPNSPVTLNVVSGNTAEGTVSPSTLTFIPSEWNIPQSVTVTPIDDIIVDGPQNYNITVSVDGANSDDNFDLVSEQIVTVVNNDSVISLNGDVSLAEGNAGTTIFNFQVNRTGDLTDAATVNYTVAGSGVNPADNADFVGGSFPNDQIIFLAGEATAFIEVEVNGDLMVESDETFTITLSNPNPNTALGTATAIGTIGNDDSNVMSIDGDETFPEGNTGTTAFTFSVTRTGDSSSSASATFTVTSSGTSPANAADFSGNVFPTGSVNFAAGSSTATITVNVNGDVVVEPNETFTVTLSNPSSGYVLGTATAIGTIGNDDSNVMSIDGDETFPEGNTGTTAFTFSVTRTGDSSSSASATFTVTPSGTSPANGADFSGNVFPTGPVNFVAGSSTATITVNVNGDVVVEPNETFTVTLSNPSSGYVLGTATAIGTIENDDRATLSINDVSEDENGGAMTFIVTLNGTVPSGFVVSYATANGTASAGSDYTSVSNNLTFLGNDGETHNIQVGILDDGLPEGNETFSVNLTVSNSFVELLKGQGVGTIVDNDSCVTEPMRVPGVPITFCANFVQDLNDYVAAGDIPTGFNLIWSRSDNFNIVGARLTNTEVTSAGIYYGFLSNGNCTSTPLEVNLAQIVPPTIVSTVPATICGPGTAIIRATASAAGGSIYWYDSETATSSIGQGLSYTAPNVLATTVYYVEVLANGCTSERVPVTVTVTDPIAIGTTVDNGAACNEAGGNDTSIDLDNTRVGTGLASGVWSIVSTPSGTVTIDADNIVNFEGAPVGAYVFRLTTNIAVAPCVDQSVDVTITVGSCTVDTDGDGLLDRDEIALGLDPNNRDTDGDGIDDATEVGPDINNPLDLGGIGIIDALNPCYPNISNACTVDLGLEKTVDKASTSEGNEVVFTVILTNNSPIMVTNIRVNELIDPNIVGFQYVSHLASKGTYDLARGVWELDEVLPLEENTLTITAIVVREGTFQNVVTLVDSFPDDVDPANNMARVSVTVGPRPNDECGFLFNQISPNGDGTNDALYINCIDQYPNNSIQIYDRYGNEVFAASRYDNSWMGTGKNGDLPKGTYFYILDLGDGTEVRKGWIQIIRQ